MDTAQLNGHKRMVIYLRVSSDEQSKNNSLDVQSDDCLAYAKRNGLEVVEVMREDYTGTVPIAQRPEGGKAYDMLKRGAADGLIVWRMNRLARPKDDGDEWSIPPLVPGLAKLGREIHLCDRGQIKTDFASRLIAFLDARESGNDRRAILEKMNRGIHKKGESGRAPGKGKPPYGYRFIIVRPGAKRPVGLEVIVRPDAELSVYTVPPIISEATWAQAQARGETNKRLAERNSHREYLIGGMIKCACGFHMVGGCKPRTSGETRYYQCNSRLGFSGLEERHDHYIHADRAEQAAWSFCLRGFAAGPTLFTLERSASHSLRESIPAA